MTSKLNIAAIKELAESLKADPSLLFKTELSFLKTVLMQYGDMKEPKKKSDGGHDHSHSHADHGCCSHDEPKKAESSHSSHAHAHSSHETPDSEDEEEELDPEIIPADPGPFLAIPVGGEDFDGSADAKEKVCFL